MGLANRVGMGVFPGAAGVGPAGQPAGPCAGWGPAASAYASAGGRRKRSAVENGAPSAATPKAVRGSTAVLRAGAYAETQAKTDRVISCGDRCVSRPALAPDAAARVATRRNCWLA